MEKDPLVEAGPLATDPAVSTRWEDVVVGTGLGCCWVSSILCMRKEDHFKCIVWSNLNQEHVKNLIALG